MNWSGLASPFVAAVFLGLQIGQASEPIVVASGDSAKAPRQPQLAVDSSGSVHVVYGVGNSVVYCRSEDGGRTYAEPYPLPGTYVLALGNRRGPRIAAAGRFVCVAAIGGQQGKGRDGDVLAYSSSDGGKTWAGPATVNDAPNAAREGLHALAAGPRGQMSCVWLDLRHGKTEVFAAVSEDGGKTWGKNVRVYRSPDGHVCECCHPSVVYDRQGVLHVMWRNWLDGARDMYLSRSADGGRTFEKAVKLGQGTWPLDACPMDGGYLAATPQGDLFTAWRRNREVFLTTESARSAAPAAREQRLGAGEQPWIAATAKGPYVLWQEEETGRLLLHAPGGSHPVELASGAIDPVIAASSDGKGPVIAAWEERHGQRTAIQCQVIADRDSPH